MALGTSSMRFIYREGDVQYWGWGSNKCCIMSQDWAIALQTF